MKYLMVGWFHNFSDEPITIYSEIDEQRNEVRKIELFKAGKIGYATEEVEFGGSGLSECPLPEIEEIAADPQFKPVEITKEEFEEVWNGNKGTLRLFSFCRLSAPRPLDMPWLV
ncbi:MAG: DUF6881 domain-containing protein [Bacillota bacterium]